MAHSGSHRFDAVPRRWLARAFAIELAFDIVFSALVSVAYVGLLGVRSLDEALPVLPFLGVAFAIRTALWSTAFLTGLRPVERWLRGPPSDDGLARASARLARFPWLFPVADALLWGLAYAGVTIAILLVPPEGMDLSRRLPQATALFAGGLVLGDLALSLPLTTYLLSPVIARLSVAARARGLPSRAETPAIGRLVLTMALGLPLAATAWLTSAYYLSDVGRTLERAEAETELRAHALADALDALQPTAADDEMRDVVWAHAPAPDAAFVADAAGVIVESCGATEALAKHPSLSIWLRDAIGSKPEASHSDPRTEQTIAFTRARDGRVVGAIARMQSPPPSSLAFVVVFFLVPSVWAPICAYFLVQIMANPVRDVARALRRISRGEDAFGAEPIPVRSRDELGELAERTNDMIARLAESTHEAAEYQRALVQSHATLEEGERAQALLAHASRVLAESFDYDEAVRGLARIAVTYLADWCVVYAADNHAPRVAAVAHRDADAEELLGALLAPAGGGAPLPRCVERALRDGAVSTSTDVAKQLLADIAASAPAADRRPLVPTAALVVPLAARGRRLGCVVLAATEPGRRYDGPELSLCEELSRTCAIAMDNARLYRDAQAALRAREDFLTVAAHELRTPLTSLRLRLAAAQRSLRHPDLPLERHTLEAAVAAAVRQTDRLSRLTELVLEATSETRLVEREVDLVEVVRDTVARLSEDARNAGCRIELRAPATLIGTWDADRLHHALTNLLLNAIKFGSNAPIEIDVHAEADTAELTVVDHGMGIAEDKQRLVFERFGRGVSTRHYGGLGLGLHVARRVVERHGGSLTVQSNPGAGARFTVTLPLRVSPAALDRAS